MGQKMEKQYEQHTTKKSGYVQRASVYQAKRCEGCPLRGACHKSKTNRIITLNHNLKQHRQKARAKLISDTRNGSSLSTTGRCRSRFW